MVLWLVGVSAVLCCCVGAPACGVHWVGVGVFVRLLWVSVFAGVVSGGCCWECFCGWYVRVVLSMDYNAKYRLWGGAVCLLVEVSALCY